MKKGLLLILLLALFMVSCSDDDDSTEQHPIVSKWQVDNAYLDVETNKENVTEELKRNNNIAAYEQYSTSTTIYNIKKEDRCVITTDGEIVYDGTYKVSKDIFRYTELYKDGPIETRYTFAVTDGTLTLARDYTKTVKRNIGKYISNKDDLVDLIIEKVALNLELSTK